MRRERRCAVKADISRSTFDPRFHLFSLRKQQGRVDLDADWNEQQDIDEHLRTVCLTDVIGPAGGPIDDAAFGLTAAGADLLLSPGRYYVAGRLCECEEQVSVFAQPDLPGADFVVRRLDGTWVTDGTPPPQGVYAAVLDVWTQLRTVVEAPALREVALGGPDTAARLRQVWQVRLLQAAGPGGVVGCADEPPGYAELTAPSTGTLAVWADPTGPPTGDCLIPTASPYRGLDNQYYRVEIHDGGAPGAATYVWSRDNGSIVVSWDSTDVDVLTVKNPGRDGSAGFSPGCWVELTDDEHELTGWPGTLVQVDTAEGDRIVVKPATATGSIDRLQFKSHARARRWDGRGTVPADGSEIVLELGVKISFSSTATDVYRTFDHWSFPARAATHDVEWPRNGGGPLALTSQGPRHDYARLAVAAFDGASWTVQRDCRPLFAPLVDQLALAYVSGDTQQALPNVADADALVPLAHDLIAGVATGGRPVAAARVRFRVVSGKGRLGGSGASVTVETGADGLARTAWEIDSGTAVQEVVAELLAENGTPRGLPVTYSARPARAADVGYNPAACADLAGAVTVQQAIDRLCTISGGGCATLVVSPGAGWVEALKALPAGADAVVCFRPGRYEADVAVELAALGHVRLSGAGAATQLEFKLGEAGLVFRNCPSVRLSDLCVAVLGFPAAPQSGLLGAVTILDCAEVELERLRVSCPGAGAFRATCVTVRSGGDRPDGPAAGSVRVRDCEFTVGETQTGVLVVNADQVDITGNGFSTPPKPPVVTVGDRLKDALWQRRFASRLVGELVADRADRVQLADFNTAVRVSGFVARFNSSIPQAEWSRLVAANPPSSAEIADAPAVQGYVARIADAAAQTPGQLPSFDRQITRLRTDLGASANQIFGTDQGLRTVRALLTAGVVDIKPASEVAAVRREIAIPTSSGAVRFNSPIPQGAWESALAAMPPKDQSQASVARQVRAVARRLVADPAFEQRISPGLLAGLFTRDPAAAHCSVSIGGGVVGVVSVEANRMVATAEAVHIGTSFKRTPGAVFRKARTVRLRGNEVVLAVPVDRPAAKRGIFVGNASRVVVEDNHLVVDGGRVTTGVHLEGAYDRHLVVRDNELDETACGVLLVPRGPFPPSPQWVIADNLAPGASPVVNAPTQARVTGNVG
jgi:hypothetical protein